MSTNNGDMAAFASPGIPGMSKRELIANYAPVSFEMAAIIAGSTSSEAMYDRDHIWQVLAALRYEYADAMLEAAKK